eukprot:CAMPEP_0179190308 /NCGR_PEP_ID=MMETSP0796-20121207/94489_1 /TAXON_ID=73915 /ORGANISM="Pyrodinium bahamense, Strain pbaha01" /LENGTH=233 /DNA_ID=CAMNT_0020894467 /DNA_START=124 /DNA_END=824 /DNA_ORIENTATION=+
MSSNATQSHKPWRTKTAGKEGCFSGTAKKRCAKRKPTKPVQRMCMVINARMLLVTTYWCAKSPTSPIWPLGRRMCCESSKRSSSRKGLIMYSMFSIDSKPAPAASAQRNTASGVSARRHQQVQTLVENQKQQVRGTALPWHLSTQVASWSTHQGLVFIRHRIQPALNSSSQSPGGEAPLDDLPHLAQRASAPVRLGDGAARGDARPEELKVQDIQGPSNRDAPDASPPEEVYK